MILIHLCAPPNKKRRTACRIVSMLILSISAISSTNCPAAKDKTAKIRFTSAKSPLLLLLPTDFQVLPVAGLTISN